MIDLSSIDVSQILPFIAVGFAAQVIDGALGMAFGVISSTMMVSLLGISPTRASAGVHFVEMFTTAASAISHIAHKNVDWRLFGRLVIPGLIGGVLGAYVLVLNADIARPFVMAYLTGVGVYLLWRAFHTPPKAHRARIVAPLGLIGGFLDAAGGGGWGPIVTSNLLIQGVEPRKTIGTVNTAEFFLTVSVSITFIAAMGFAALTIVTGGLLIGGVLAAPLGAVLAKRVQPRTLLILVGIVLTATSAFSLWRAVAA
ncbi:sulfite exporter TauE/SafE family protein [Sphingomonas flavalba]|uniref:sulfite exporter TauE/SafE family protein n=1 Tax=Sphingomonas flavalba TaxID=2559804 RepID=UPI0039DF6223